MRFIILFILLSLLVSCGSRKKESHEHDYFNNYKRTKAQYYITKIDSTKNYYILNSYNTETLEPVKLVIEQKSEQLEGKKIKINNKYKFETYSFYEFFNAGGIICHEVEKIKVWCTSEDGDLRFTDSMGNVSERK